MRNVAFLTLSLLALHGVRADELPKRPDFARYQPMMTRSPFAVATAVIAPAATPDFAKDLFVANAAKSPEGDMVTIGSSSDRNFKKYITTRAPVDGYSIASIEWSDKVGATRVTISKDGKFATLTFNQALLTAPITSTVQQPGMPMQQPNMAVPAPTPMAVPGIVQPQVIPPKPIPVPPQPATNQPRVRGVIPRQPNTNTAPAATPPAQIVVPTPDPDDE